MASCKPSTAARIANVWPGMTLATSVQFTRIGRGLPISRPNQFAQIHARYYHVVDYPTTGASIFNFFNQGASEGVTNLNNGLVPDERPFWLTGVCVTVQDLTAAGADSGAKYAATAAPLTRAQEINQILSSGLFQLRVSDRMILDVQDLTHFPSDGGVFVGSNVSTQATAALGSAVWWNNGSPMAGNRFRLPAPYPILPGKPISAQIKFQALKTITTAARVKVELVGESIMPLNG